MHLAKKSNCMGIVGRKWQLDIPTECSLGRRTHAYRLSMWQQCTAILHLYALMANRNRQQPNAESIWKMRFRPDAREREKKKSHPNFFSFQSQRVSVFDAIACLWLCLCMHNFYSWLRRRTHTHLQSHTTVYRIGGNLIVARRAVVVRWWFSIRVNLLCWWWQNVDESCAFRRNEEGTVTYVHSKSVSCVCHLMPKKNYALAGCGIATNKNYDSPYETSISMALIYHMQIENWITCERRTDWMALWQP